MITVEKQRMLKKYEERLQLREEYERERIKEVHIKAKKSDRYGKEDMLNLPRHRMYGKCLDFEECPIDYKCRNYNSTYMKCVNCELVKTGEICQKKHIHNPETFNMMISRERIDLDDKNS
ncbi:MAG TPA: hypothetical protein VEY51_05850 [Chondromyces sp.]|nr:hypothetical protein [Chondromyces sp.]